MERFILGVAYFFTWPINSQEIPLATIVLWPIFILISLKYKNIKIAYMLNVCLLFVMYFFYYGSPYRVAAYIDRVKFLLYSLNHLENVAREYHESSGLWQYQTNVNVFSELSEEAVCFSRIVSPVLIDLWGPAQKDPLISRDTLRFAIIAIEDDALLYGYELKESPYFLRVQKKLAQRIKYSKDINPELVYLGTLRDITLCTSDGEPFAVNNDDFCVFTKFYPYNPSFRKKISRQTLKALQGYAYTTKYIRNVNSNALRK
jgi:hypothetical protein